MTTFQELAVAMIKCEQTSGQSVYQHGVSVKQHLDELIGHLECSYTLEGWRLPDWIFKYKDQIVSNLHDRDVLSLYAIYHDCGKPFCKVTDDEGKSHFPGHAETSKKMFLEAGGDPIAANLIGWDMDLHTLNSVEIQSRCEKDWSVKDVCTLLLTAFAEIHSNSKLFGGTDSVSFKSKFKTLDRRGKQICKFYFGEKK